MGGPPLPHVHPEQWTAPRGGTSAETPALHARPVGRGDVSCTRSLERMSLSVIMCEWGALQPPILQSKGSGTPELGKGAGVQTPPRPQPRLYHPQQAAGCSHRTGCPFVFKKKKKSLITAQTVVPTCQPPTGSSPPRVCSPAGAGAPPQPLLTWQVAESRAIRRRSEHLSQLAGALRPKTCLTSGQGECRCAEVRI